jgi:hypothetical protein
LASKMGQKRVAGLLSIARAKEPSGDHATGKRDRHLAINRWREILTLLMRCCISTQQLACQGECLVIILTRGNFWHFDIRHDSRAIKRAAGRRKVTPGRQPQRTTASTERNDRLLRSPAKRAGADHSGALMVLERADNDLGAGSRTTVAEHHERLTIDDVARVRLEMVDLLGIGAPN